MNYPKIQPLGDKSFYLLRREWVVKNLVRLLNAVHPRPNPQQFDIVQGRDAMHTSLKNSPNIAPAIQSWRVVPVFQGGNYANKVVVHKGNLLAPAAGFTAVAPRLMEPVAFEEGFFPFTVTNAAILSMICVRLNWVCRRESFVPDLEFDSDPPPEKTERRVMTWELHGFDVVSVPPEEFGPIDDVPFPFYHWGH